MKNCKTLFTKKAFILLVTDLSLHLIPELLGFRKISQIDRTKVQCMVGSSLPLYCLKTAYPIFVKRLWFEKSSRYVSCIFYLVFTLLASQKVYYYLHVPIVVSESEKHSILNTCSEIISLTSTFVFNLKKNQHFFLIIKD